jgi:hypothetical protein
VVVDGQLPIVVEAGGGGHLCSYRLPPEGGVLALKPQTRPKTANTKKDRFLVQNLDSEIWEKKTEKLSGFPETKLVSGLSIDFPSFLSPLALEPRKNGKT